MSNDVLSLARKQLLEPAELNESRLQSVLSKMMISQVDAADLYFQVRHSESWVLEDNLIKGGSFSLDRGVGARVISGEQTGFAYADDIVLPALDAAAQAASRIACYGGGEKRSLQAWQCSPAVKALYPIDNPLLSCPESIKLSLLKKIDAEARQMDPRVTHVIANLQAMHEVIFVIASDGSLAADVRPLVVLRVSVVVEQEGRREQGQAGGGGRFTYDYFLEEDRALQFAREAVRQALINLEAIPAPAGTMPVVLGPGWPGVLLHEAIGHGLEGDAVRKGSSAFAGRMGEQVASPICTIVDEGTLPGRRGSLHVDDEGTPCQRTVLIERGVLKGYMQDKLNARLLGTRSTGNGRRESYAHLPIPRMTNTYMLPGSHTSEEIIASVDKGIYAANFSGGQVDITSGKFVFSACEAYLIEKGKITQPIKGATLIGHGPEVLTRISMLGNDLSLDQGTAVCGKDNQWVPVSVGQPTLKIDSLTVGGTVA